MKSCPRCRLQMPVSARVCRACYTVLPETDQVDLARRMKLARTMGGITKMFIGFAIALGAWLFQFNVELSPGLRSAIQDWGPAATESVGRVFGVQQSVAQTGEEVTGAARYQPVPASAVEHEGQGCAINQAVGNVGEKPLSRVVLKFAFDDDLGNPIGTEADAIVAAVLPAGEERNFTFRLPCPQTIGSVKVQIPSRTTKASEPQIVLVSAGWTAEAASENSPQLAIKVSEPAVCRSPSSCILAVSFDDGETARFWFRRDPEAPEMLIAKDPRLIDYLQRRRTAKLLVPSSSGEFYMKITDQDLRGSGSEAQAGPFARWIRRLF
ncbi:MAG: hypothetical protein Q8R44_18830 [Novosphingobium sp.]|nr:hypothetical protein [Novosphingobium sp.]